MKRNNLISVSTIFVFILGTMLLLQSCGNKSNQTEELIGLWKRSDGNYNIEIKEFRPENKLVAFYFNPNPINVGRAEWRIENKKVELFIELKDKNYPGSLYQLTYDKEKKVLYGTYYQAVAKETYEVFFNKK